MKKREDTKQLLFDFMEEEKKEPTPFEVYMKYYNPYTTYSTATTATTYGNYYTIYNG